MEVSSDSVLIGNYIEVKFVLVNIDSKFEAPSFEGFQIVGGPNHASSMSSINGDVRKQATYSYFVEPLTEGEHFIDPVSVEVGDNTLESEPMKITVHPNPEGIIQRPSLTQEFHFDFDGFFGNDPFLKKKNKEQKEQEKKSKVKKRKI